MVVRLPRGRHGMTRAEVVRSQRDRVLTALIDAIGEKGYARTSVADVLFGAGVSRETFYQQFSSKHDCFLAAFDAAGERLLANLAETPTGGTAEATFDALLATYLDALARDPAAARLYLVEVHAAGPEALARRAAMQERFTNALAGLFDARGPQERFACELLVAGIGSLVSARLAAGDADGLRQLHAPIVELVKRTWFPR
ncbi:MAG: TetR/AcrR family transcriptional regulator [Acidimicrobiales bacterium]